MQVCVIKNSEPKNISIPKTATIGGMLGLAVRQFLPAQQGEIDTFLFNQADTLKRDSSNTAIKEFIKDIKLKHNKNPENQVYDLFIKSKEAKSTKEIKYLRNIIKNTPVEIQEQIATLRNNLASKIYAARQLSKTNIQNAVKQSRPVWAYLLPGIALGSIGAFVYNVIGTITED